MSHHALYTTTFIFMGAVMLNILFIGEHLTSIFTSEPEIIRISPQELSIITLGYIFFGQGMVMVKALKKVSFDKKQLRQPVGPTFGDQGEMYIASKGSKGVIVKYPQGL